MARLAQAPITQKRTISNPDSLPDLNRLLDRLQENILRADAERERRLRTSEYERAKARVNIDYARSLLTKLEHDALTIKVHTRRQEVQNDLNGKREVLEQITERFRELEEISVDSDDDSSEGEDLLGDIINTPSESIESTSATDQRGDDDDTEDVGEQPNDEAEIETEESPSLIQESQIPDHRQQSSSAMQSHQATTTTTTSSAPEPTPSGSGTSTSQTLRPRGGASQQPLPSDVGETSALRTQLFGTRPDPTTTSTPSTTEAIMDLHRAEQDKLTESMVGMARALKESTHRFASSLREDEDVVRAAGTNLERNERGLGAVAGRMGALRRLTEGKGWWGRMLLYLWIAGLAVFAVLLVFVFPKLRF
ncbi:hypothetical protein F5Y00DRAFT_259270 [Daldinia vernicosa]|uniref:uncharacterized protein n=1 Tax=Daldinia vernicosa TaxID=114800 RepID=UPI0020076532|nr:uncharacterized protein F5Y00DRAFT_259270 [Daldinia vernicosa]KAI0851780.1 hypothetical protein F5Y00DRAFT_259270 [Daldinia vernicosa]